MRKPLIAGNWKMNKTSSEARELVEKLKSLLFDVTQVEVVVSPPFTSLETVRALTEGSNIRLGAQNLHWKETGAYTGEVSPLMLKELGCRYVIIGHSERRIHFKESNELINRKLKAAISYNIAPILCVGEKLEEREGGVTEKVVREQLEKGLDGISKEEALRAVIAYEPVWAIGTGRTATPKQASEVHRFIRKLLKDRYDEDLSSQLRILYGGSVTPENSLSLMAEEEIDGALVGGASLEADSFAKIVSSAVKQREAGS